MLLRSTSTSGAETVARVLILDSEAVSALAEKRKGMAPQEPINQDDALYHDRLTSQRYAVDNPEASWDEANKHKDKDTDEPTARIPDDIPQPY